MILQSYEDFFDCTISLYDISSMCNIIPHFMLFIELWNNPL